MSLLGLDYSKHLRLFSRPTTRAVLRIVASYYRTTISAILEKRRNKSTTPAKITAGISYGLGNDLQEICKTLKRSRTTVQQYINDYDHSTVDAKTITQYVNDKHA